MAGATGVVTDIIGVVINAKFPENETPEIYNALEIPLENGKRLVAEVQQQLGGGMVKAVAMSSTDGMRRGVKAIDTGRPIAVPVGAGTLGRVFDVLGDPIDGEGRCKRPSIARSIARPPRSRISRQQRRSSRRVLRLST